MSNEIEITQNGAGVSEIAQPKSELGGLWCIYLAGPDDLVAMPSKAVAEAVARNFNAVWDRYGAERDLKVHAVANVEPWMHGKAAHTKDLREHFHEYADLVLDEDAGRFKSAQPVEAVDVRTAFETWAGAKGYALHIRDMKGSTRLGEYGYADTQRLWETWQAALAQPRPVGVPDGPLTGKYANVLVPFVALMERELHANAGKGDRPGWLGMTRTVAVLEIHHHVAKLQKAVLNGDIAGVREYAADVANMSMMAVDVCGALLGVKPLAGDQS